MSESNYWTHEHRADLTVKDKHLTRIHLDGFRAQDGSATVLAIVAFGDSDESLSIVVGEPDESPLLDGKVPPVGGFACGPDAAERLAHELLAAAALVRSTRRG